MLAFHRIVGDGFREGAHDGEGTWTGPWIAPGFPIDSIVPSWNAATPGASRVEVEVQGRAAGGRETPWYALGRWALDDTAFRRTSVPDQADAFAAVDVDTLRCLTPFDSYRLRLRLHAAPEGHHPSVRQVAAIAAGASPTGKGTSAPSLPDAVELDVPAYSQRIHAGEYPEYDGGGASWCSPTSTSMVVAFWGTGPTEDDLAWVAPDLVDPFVDHAARSTYDEAYGGAGNWPFNTAYAATFGLDAFVTRLRSLAEAELFLAAGIPLVASIAVEPGGLDGFSLGGGTAGHLVVVAGVTPDGNPIVNDPAAESNADVRRVYDRAQFERAWIGGSGGIVYVIHPPDVALPPSPGNW